MILTAIVIAQAAPAPKRTLVYTYSVGITNDTTDSSMQNRLDNTYTGGKTDLGTITVGIAGVEPDGGVVATITETGRDNRSVAPATCVAYPNTNVLCDSQSITPEEFAILRTLNPKFLDPTALDARSHWHLTPRSGLAIDYTMGKPDAAGNTPITGTRDDEQPQSTEHTEITYTYNPGKLVAPQIKEYARIHENQGASIETLTIDITAALQSDSSASN